MELVGLIFDCPRMLPDQLANSCRLVAIGRTMRICSPLRPVSLGLGDQGLEHGMVSPPDDVLRFDLMEFEILDGMVSAAACWNWSSSQRVCPLDRSLPLSISELSPIPSPYVLLHL